MKRKKGVQKAPIRKPEFEDLRKLSRSQLRVVTIERRRLQEILLAYDVLFDGMRVVEEVAVRTNAIAVIRGDTRDFTGFD